MTNALAPGAGDSGGWIRIGATLDSPAAYGPISEAQFAARQAGGASFYHGGMSYAELLVAGHNAYLNSDSLASIFGQQSLASQIGLSTALGSNAGMPFGTVLEIRNVGSNTSYRIAKSDVGSGQADDPHYKIDLHPAIAKLLNFPGKGDVEVRLAAGAGVSTPGGGAVGLGGTGTGSNAAGTAPFMVGDPTNPHEDYWTACNRLAQQRYWYFFSDAETVYLADGPDLMAQTPAMVIDRLADIDKIQHLSFTWDNCLALDTPIPTPSGWTTMGEIRSGDYVLGSNGRPTRVVGVSEIHENHDCYRVVFDDRTEIVADGGHLWETSQGIVSTDEIRGSLRYAAGYRHRVRTVRPLDLPRRELPVDPYWLGYWLGDGNAGHPMISTSRADAPSLLREIRRAGYSYYAREKASTGHGTEPYVRVSTSPLPTYRRAHRNEDCLSRRLRTLGVIDAKHIPAMYLRASLDQRLSLLQGLMDADGTPGGGIQLGDERLARDTLELIRSLGYRPSWRDEPPRGVGKKRRYRIGFTTAQRNLPPVFRLPRKAEQDARRRTEKTYERRAGRAIVAVEPTASVPVRCIAVDAEDHLYLASEAMIPTHNTAFQWVATHKRRKRLQRRSTTIKISSPVEAELDVICPIDAVRAGDVIQLVNCGPGDGRWLVGDCSRSVFQVYSQLRLVLAVSPLTERQIAGVNATNSSTTGAAATRSGSGTVYARMVSAAATINNQQLPYVWGGGHAQVGTPSIGRSGGPGYDGHTVGYDCSGSVAAVLRAGGLWSSTSIGTDRDIPAALIAAGLAVQGMGSGVPEITIFDNPGVHVYMRFNSGHGEKYWGTHGSSGPGWYDGSPEPGFIPYYIPRSILEKT